MKRLCYSLILTILLVIVTNSALAQNPLIRDQFTADPTARVFEGKMYVYPSHDIPVPPGSGARANWFCMEDYHVFSSENLMDWTDHGVILSQTTVSWVRDNAYSMWAPDCAEKDGKYYFYFPAMNRIGVAVADKPYGPFKPEAQSIQGIRGGIDPCVLIDKDGTAYLYYSMNAIFVAKLKDNMIEVDTQPQRIANLPTRGLVEGPFTFERNGIYYLTYPHEVDGQERLEYATADNPLGPFEQKGVIMDQSESGCWTNHHSIVEYQGQWYLFYHDKDLSPNFDKNRAIKADYLSFNEDGTIQKVIPTIRGVGIADAKKEIQIDRYSEISNDGVKVEFNDPNVTFNGWKTVMSANDSFIRFNKVDFGQSQKSVIAKAMSKDGSSIEIRIDKVDGQLLAKVDIAKGSEMSEVKSNVSGSVSGVHDLFVIHKDDKPVEIDWIKFE